MSPHNKIIPPKYFTIHENDVGTEAYNDAYVHDLEAEIKRLKTELREVKKQRDEAREENLAAILNHIKDDLDESRADG